MLEFTPRLVPAPALVFLHEVVEAVPDVEVDALVTSILGCVVQYEVGPQLRKSDDDGDGRVLGLLNVTVTVSRKLLCKHWKNEVFEYRVEQELKIEIE